MTWGHILPQSSFWFKKARNSEYIVTRKGNKQGVPPVKKTESKKEELAPPQHRLVIPNKSVTP